MYLKFHPLSCGHSLFLPLSATGGGRIKTLSYANGHRMEAFDNAYGERIAEKWCDAADTLIAQYRYAYDGNPNVVRSIDILGLSEYNNR